MEYLRIEQDLPASRLFIVFSSQATALLAWLGLVLCTLIDVD